MLMAGRCPARRPILSSRPLSEAPEIPSKWPATPRFSCEDAATRQVIAMPNTVDQITIRRPDDWHVHLRDGAMMAAVLPLTARQFGRAIVMPNLVPPVTTIAAAIAYRQRITNALPRSLFPPPQAGEGQGGGFTPLMTAYLTDATDPEEIVRGHRQGVFTAVK